MPSLRPLHAAALLLLCLFVFRVVWVAPLTPPVETFLRGTQVDEDSLPPDATIWIVTPTHNDRRRYADLTGIAAGFYRFKDQIRWIFVEDAEDINLEFDQFIAQEGFRYTYVAKPNTWKVCKGLDARNWGLRYALENLDISRQNFFLFADDDNRFSSKLLPLLARETKTVSAWPVGNIGYGISTPLLDEDGKVYQFFDHYRRKWSLDMAGFGANLNWMLSLRKPEEWQLKRCAAGLQETNWVDLFKVDYKDFTCLGKCETLLAFHTKTVKYPVWKIKGSDYKKTYSKATNLSKLMDKYPEYEMHIPDAKEIAEEERKDAEKEKEKAKKKKGD